MGITIINRRKDGVRPTPEEIRNDLLSLPDNDRAFIYTDPEANEHKIITMARNQDGLVKYDYESEAE